MPLFEHRYSLVVKSQNGEEQHSTPHDSLQRMGPLLRVAISITPEFAEKLSESGGEVPSPQTGFALIDTGASITAVDESVCRALGLSSTGIMKMGHAGGSEDRACYPIQVLFPGTQLPPMTNPRTVSCKLQPSNVMLLFGRDLLARLRMVYHGPAGRIELAF